MPLKFNPITGQLDLVNVSTGEIGPQGYQGNQGFQGQGIQGPQGNQGNASTVQGPQGTQGNQGIQGTLGVDGTQGPQGTQGNQGNDANMIGPQGYQGNQGNQGPQGIQGVQGNQGNQGTKYPWKGAWVTSTSYVINDCVGEGGSGYVCVSDHTSETWSTDLAYPRWNLLVQMGNQGNQGDIGSQGSIGSQGVQGIQGSQGNIGVQGSQGIQGIQGIQGSQGTQGNQGLIGTQGNQGSQGNQGDQGEDSTVAGPQGTQGNQGNQGFQGADSTAVGTQGPQGYQGNIGTTGSQGTQGNQGASVTGVQGNQGSTGSQGNQGVQGVQGVQGNQGSMASLSVTTKGDIQTYSTTPARLPVGTDGQVLESRSTETTGLKWIDPISGGSTDGWTIDSNTWVYVGAHQFKITGSDVTLKFPIGTRIRYKQGGSYEYGVVILSAFSTDTTVTLAPNSDYALANATITDAEYSYQDNPQGYPDIFNFTPTYGSLTEGSGSSIGLFKINGKELKFKIKFTFAADSSVTGTPIRWSNLIGTMNSIYANLTQIGFGTTFDANGGSNRIIVDRSGYLFTDYTNGQYANTSSTSPFTWTTSDSFELQGWYLLA